MNKQEMDIIKYISEKHHASQRMLAEHISCSLGMVNKSLRKLHESGYIDEKRHLTDKANILLTENKPQRAILLAAGIGLRMMPINQSSSKGMLKIKGISLVENLILKLKESGIKEICLVVGFMKEQYEFLIDKYHVHLIVNPVYYETNNVYSLYLARRYLCNVYILPCDVWLDDNPFHEHEIYSWYMMKKENAVISDYVVNRKSLIYLNEKKDSNYRPMSIAYLNKEDSAQLGSMLEKLTQDSFYKKRYYWETLLFEKNLFNIYLYENNSCCEINTYEDLRLADPDSESLISDVIQIISNALHVQYRDIYKIEISKRGMTNRSFTFMAKNEKYIMRIPGEGTEQLINRYQEGQVYEVIRDFHFSDDVYYFNPENGYKITKYLHHARNCRPDSVSDLTSAMKLLRKFHDMDLRVDHYFDLFEKIEFYESLRKNISLYSDYAETKAKVMKLKAMIDQLPLHITLTHMDAVCDNFLFYNEDGQEKIRLIDWEYASMQDSDVDLAMFSIYSMYQREEIDRLIDIYYENCCDALTRIKIYCYIAICGLLWSNWCEYKHTLGVEFGEYSLAQYRFAKEYSQIAVKEYERVMNSCIK